MGLTILIIEDEINARENISEYLSSRGFITIGAGTLAEGRAVIERGDADVVLLDVMLPDGYGPNLLLETAHIAYRPPIIIITAYGDIPMAVEAMRNGAQDFLQKPLNFGQIEQSINRVREIISMRRELNHLREAAQLKGGYVVGKSKAMETIFNTARRAASKSLSVLITGETGTGKDILAQIVHKSGQRADKQFIAINCAAIQPTVLESELFGYEAGAFTGAERRKPGLLEVADGGVLFLDEISSMPLDIQAKLLRAIEEKAFRRVGGTTLIKVDVEIVAASNRNLPSMIEAGQFRQDLYYRLKVVDLDLPPLRERKEDIPEFIGFFIKANNRNLGMNVRDMTPRALEAMMAYRWPGNIRELNHAIERAMLFCDGEVIDIEHLPSDIVRLPS